MRVICCTATTSVKKKMKSTTTFVIFSALILGLAESKNYTDCAKKLSVLERALYETGDNELQLNRAFFPARQQTSRYIAINYTFLKNSSSDINCTVTFLWSIGGFLLIQPPRIFQFTSLLFNAPSNSVEKINITLPYDCRPLVLNSSGLCSCNNSMSQMDSSDINITLDILSQQIDQYAKYINVDQVVRDDNSDAQAVCDTDLGSKFDRREVHFFLGIAVVLPIFSLILIIAIVRSYHEEIQGRLIAPSNHNNLAGTSLTSLYVMAYVLGVDIAAVVHYHTNNHEYMDYDVKRHFGLWVVYFPLIFDVICGIFITLAVLLYVLFSLIVEIKHSVDHRFRQDGLKLYYKELEKGFHYHSQVKIWLQREILKKRSYLLSNDVLKPKDELALIQQRQEQIKMIEKLYEAEMQQRKECERLSENFHESIKKVHEEEHLLIMEKQYRLQKCEQLINEQLGILSNDDIIDQMEQELKEKEKICFFLDNDQFTSLLNEKYSLECRLSMQDLQNAARRNMRVHTQLVEEEQRLTESLTKVNEKIRKKKESLESRFTTMYTPQALADEKRRQRLSNKLQDKLTQVRENTNNWLKMTSQEHKILDQLLQQQLGLTWDWKQFDKMEKEVQTEVMKCINSLKKNSETMILSTNPKQLQSSSLQKLKYLVIKVEKSQGAKEKLQQREICLLQESEDFLRLRSRDLQIRNLLKKHIKYLHIFPMIFFITGYHNKLSVAKHLNVWFVSTLLYGLIFVIASHLGYILIAWLTQPERTSSTALWGIAMFMFLFLMFRALYGSGKDFKGFLFYDSSNKDNYCLALLSVFFIPMLFPFVSCFKKIHKHKEDSFREESLSMNMSIRNFSVVGFLVAGVWGLVFVAILSFLTAAFVVVPLPTFSLGNYLQNVFQIVFFIFATLISYKVFAVHQSELYGFFKSFNRKYFKESEKIGKTSRCRAADMESGLNEDEFETAGSIAANVAVHLAS